MEIVAREALANGMMVENSHWLHTFKFADSMKMEQEEDHRVLIAWLRQHESLDYVKRLSEDIHAGIKSRETSD
jgi:hypothetical protein